MLLRTRLARAAATGALVLAAPVLASCSFSTDQVYTPAAGANDRDDRVDVLNAVIVSTDGQEGTFLTTLVNNDIVTLGEEPGSADKQLTSVGGEVTAVLPGPIPIKGGDLTRIATVGSQLPDGSGLAAPGIKVSGDFEIGEFVKVELTFDTGQTTTVEVPVLPNNGFYACQDGPELTPNHMSEYDHVQGDKTPLADGGCPPPVPPLSATDAGGAAE